MKNYTFELSNECCQYGAQNVNDICNRFREKYCDLKHQLMEYLKRVTCNLEEKSCPAIDFINHSKNLLNNNNHKGQVFNRIA